MHSVPPRLILAIPCCCGTGHTWNADLGKCVRLQKRPPGDMEYCHRSRGRSPKETRWEFEDDKV